MRAFAAVFAREVFARRIVFPVAFAAGFMPLAGSLAYGWSKPDAPEGRVLVALVTAAAFSFAFGLLFGGSVIAGETSEKRISFFFSRPIPSAVIWSGKLLAVFFLVLVSASLILAPALLTSSARTLGTMLGAGGHPGLNALALPGALLLLVLGAHAAVTVARLRSPWVALDLLLAPALVLFTGVVLRSLSRSHFGSFEFEENLSPLGLAFAVVPLLALLAGSYAQVAEGRTDARRAHGAFSAVFFGIVGAAVALLGGYAWWCASAKATDLAEVGRSVETAPRGPWVAASGRLSAARGGGRFLFDAVGARSLRIHGYGEVLSADGTHAAWGEPRFGFFERKDNRIDVFVADLATGRAVATGLETSGWVSIALSQAGRRLAIRDGRTLAVYDVSDAANPKQLAAFPVAESGFAFAFTDDDTIRVFPRVFNASNPRQLPQAPLEITELSLPSKKSLVTGRFEGAALPWLRLSADARTLVGTRRASNDSQSPTILTLHDGRTGVVLATLATDLRNPQTRFLGGNRLVVLGIADAKARALFFEGEKGWGSPARMVELGAAKRVVLGGEIAPGRVALSLLPFEENLPASQRAAKLVSVDAATGAVSPLADGLVPADRMGWWLTPALPPAEAGAPWASLFLDADDRLVRLDPATGAQTVLLGKAK